MLKTIDNKGVIYYDRATINKIYGQGFHFTEEAILNMKDSVFTYFGAPVRLSDPSLLKVEGELQLEIATN